MKTNLNQNFRLQLPATTTLKWNQVNWKIAKATKSNLKAEKYLENFAKFAAEFAIASGIGDREELGKGIQIHISDTVGRKKVTNRNGGSHAIGLCYPKASSKDDYRVIEIDRGLSNTVNVLMVVAHEVSHAVLSEGHGHDKTFENLVFGVFKMSGKATCTTESPEFLNLIADWVNSNGLYPHTPYVDLAPKQTTRQIKVACLNYACSGGTDSSRKQGYGMITRVSSGVVAANSTPNIDKETGEIEQKALITYDKDGEVKDIDYIDSWSTSLNCMACGGRTVIRSQMPFDLKSNTSILYQ